MPAGGELEGQDLELWQVEKLQEAIQRHWADCGPGWRRWASCPATLFDRVEKAHDAIHDLRVHLHYLSCDVRRTQTDKRQLVF